MSKIISWLKSLFTKSEVKTVSEQIVDPAVAQQTLGADGAAAVQPAVVEQPVVATDPAPAVSDLDAFAAKLKSILIFAGHDVEAVFEEAVALAKKM